MTDTHEAKVYSQRLGAIRDDQFAAAVARFDLGTFVGAAPTTAGLFGQNAFVTTTRGDFVLRGAPHWVKGSDGAYRPEKRWQFTKETFFARKLHEQTKAPVAWPYLHDETSDIFGWPYVLMPRMPGRCFNDRDILKELAQDDRRGVAAALGETLHEMQRLTWPFAGDFDANTIELTPYTRGSTQHVIDETYEHLRSADANRAICHEDIAWIDATVDEAQAAEPRPCTYVHCDYKLNNLTVSHQKNEWRVTGLFDLHEARFGDGALDVVRQACGYLDTEPPLARVFAESYFEHRRVDDALRSLIPLYVVNDRMKFWAFFTRPDARATWTKGKTFRGWAERYVNDLLEAIR